MNNQAELESKKTEIANLNKKFNEKKEEVDRLSLKLRETETKLADAQQQVKVGK